ncbi:MAG TPA: hypothetical protein VF861_04360 [Telluria sp.]
MARTITYDEAAVFERALLTRPLLPPKVPELVYTQPVNKKEPCKLPTSNDQLERNNFRAYWDGQCKQGYAFGLGRDIAISDTHHVEEITVHKGSAANFDSPSVNYDLVNNKIRYSVPDGKFPAAAWFGEDIYNNDNNFFVSHTAGMTDESGSGVMVQYSPLRLFRYFTNNERNVIYRFLDNSAMPVVDASTVAFSAEIIDPRTNTAGGVAVVRYGTGQVRQAKLDGAPPEAVVLPVEYVNHLSGKYKVIQNGLATVEGKIERARQMEREYLYLACNGKHTIDGLDNATATKICTWRSQFKAPYEKSLAKYNEDLAQLKLKAELASQQRLAQQQINIQQRQLQQQSQQELQQFANALGQMGQQMRNSGQEALNSVKLPSGQVNFAPFTPQSGDRVLCMTTGSFTTCRDN